MAKRDRKQKRKEWMPMERGTFNPSYLKSVYPDGPSEHVTSMEVWGNDEYEATVEHWRDGWAYISLKRYDRHAVRDWRHLQSIKNEVVGPEREAVELFPAESRLMDEANHYHLFVLPKDEPWPFGQQFRTVATPADARANNESMERETGRRGRGRQRAWQPGLSTGPGNERRDHEADDL